MAGNKFFAADDARIRKITRTVPETIASAEFKLFFALLIKNLLFNNLDLSLLWLV